MKAWRSIHPLRTFDVLIHAAAGKVGHSSGFSHCSQSFGYLLFLRRDTGSLYDRSHTGCPCRKNPRQCTPLSNEWTKTRGSKLDSGGSINSKCSLFLFSSEFTVTFMIPSLRFITKHEPITH